MGWTALGVYEAEIDGAKVGDAFLAPGYTYYPGDLHVQVWDVTDMLSANSVSRVYLGRGWHCGRFTCDNKVQLYGDRPAVSWALEVEREDGGKDIFTSADDIVVTVESPYDLASEYDSERYTSPVEPATTAPTSCCRL